MSENTERYRVLMHRPNQRPMAVQSGLSFDDDTKYRRKHIQQFNQTNRSMPYQHDQWYTVEAYK